MSLRDWWPPYLRREMASLRRQRDQWKADAEMSRGAMRESQSERDEARAALADFQPAAAQVEQERDEARAEVERLRGAIEELGEALIVRQRHARDVIRGLEKDEHDLLDACTWLDELSGP